MKESIQAIVSMPSTARMVLDVSGEKASVLASTAISGVGDARYLQLTGGVLSGALDLPLLRILSGTTVTAVIQANGTNGATYFTAGGIHSWGGTGLGAMSFGTSGLSVDRPVVIASSANNVKLSVSGYGPAQGFGSVWRAGVDSAGALIFQNAAGTQVGSISQTSSATTYTTSSDYRLKENIEDLTGSGVFIDSLRPRRFIMNGVENSGFIAHEFADVSPSSVFGEKDAVDDNGDPIYQAMQASTSEVMANVILELQLLRKRVAELELAAA